MSDAMRSGFRAAVSVGLSLLASVGAMAQGGANQGPAEGRVPVLVELFTSEGCSSCPPADALLRQLSERQPVAGVEIIALGEHVDYWDELGWHDRFSAPLFTQRQQQYAQELGDQGPYTPQMVVDGKDGFVGGDRGRAISAITKAATVKKLPLVVSAPTVDGRQVNAQATLGEAGTPGATVDGATVYAALVDPEDRTEVRNGENGGRVLTHAGVVRVLGRVGTVGQLTQGPLHVSLPAPAGTDPATMRLVLFVADAGQGRILGAASKAVRAAPVVARR